jgi:hypothetical protein
VWIYAMGAGPLRFVHAPFYEPWHGAVALAVWTLVPPMFLAGQPSGQQGRKQGGQRSRSRRTERRI